MWLSALYKIHIFFSRNFEDLYFPVLKFFNDELVCVCLFSLTVLNASYGSISRWLLPFCKHMSFSSWKPTSLCFGQNLFSFFILCCFWNSYDSDVRPWGLIIYFPFVSYSSSLLLSFLSLTLPTSLPFSLWSSLPTLIALFFLLDFLEQLLKYIS